MQSPLCMCMLARANFSLWTVDWLSWNMAWAICYCRIAVPHLLTCYNV